MISENTGSVMHASWNSVNKLLAEIPDMPGVFEITFRVNFIRWQMVELLRQTLTMKSSFSVLFTEFTVVFTLPKNIFGRI